MGMKRREDTVEGFRVLTLTYRMDELPSEQRERLKELFEKYRAIASLYYWSKRLGLEEEVEQALKRAREELPSYWRKALDEESPLYAFSELEKMRRPRKHVLKLPLTEALQVRQQNEKPKNGALIDCKESKLVIYPGNGVRIKLPIPKRALSWLKEKEDEVAPLTVHRTVRIQWRPERAQALKVQIILRVERPKPPRPDPRRRYYATLMSTAATVSLWSSQPTMVSASKSSKRRSSGPQTKGAGCAKQRSGSAPPHAVASQT